MKTSPWCLSKDLSSKKWGTPQKRKMVSLFSHREFHLCQKPWLNFWVNTKVWIKYRTMARATSLASIFQIWFFWLISAIWNMLASSFGSMLTERRSSWFKLRILDPRSRQPLSSSWYPFRRSPVPMVLLSSTKDRSFSSKEVLGPSPTSNWS